MKTSCIPAFLTVILLVFYAQPVQAQEVPEFRYDPTWPDLPLPNAWTFQGVTGLTVDAHDVVWVLNTASELDEDFTENFATLDPPAALCCTKPPVIMAFDAAGSLVHSWDADEGHMIIVDSEDRVWVGSDTFRIYSRDGVLLDDFGNLAPPVPSGQERHDPATPLLIARIEGAALDERAREIYITEEYLEGRVLVFSMDPPFEFKRGWGAYGKPLGEISTEERPAYVPGGPPPEDFLGHLTIGIANDGEVYVADRIADRIQVFTKQGEFQREFWVAPQTRMRGSTGGIAFSNDSAQRYLLVPDIMNNVIWIVERATGETMSHVGFSGRAGGAFHYLHLVAADSHGNLYTGEVDTGKRVQRFTLLQ